MVKESSHNYNLDAKVNSPRTGVDTINAVFDLKNQACEVFTMLCLNTKNAVAGAHMISMGTLNSSIVHPREVMKAAILNNSSAVILFHNHPSGDTTPSREDIETTQRLKAAGDLLGIKVLDHIIIGGDNYKSFKEEGLI